jgi:DNA ligase-1
MLLSQVVEASSAVGATRSRRAKVSLLAGVLLDAEPAELAVVASWLGGSLRQRRTGVGWRSLTDLPAPSTSPALLVREVDMAFEQMATLSGPGSTQARTTLLHDLFAAATTEEQAWLRGAIAGEVRQGALDALVQEAIAAAAELPVSLVRRAAMLTGSTPEVAVLALTEGEAGLRTVSLRVGRPIQPMLASSAPDVAAAVAKAGPGEVAVDAKLDGIRIQVHRHGDLVSIATRSLDDITSRLPGVVELVRTFPGDRFVLDGEALLIADDGRPRPFQETASRTARAEGGHVAAYFFDLLHLDGVDLIDSSATTRTAALDRLVPPEHRVNRLVTSDPDAAEKFATEVLRAGHEGVVVKSLTAAYDAGRRGAAWIKVKPVHTLDLVVLAVEEGSGRRRGWLSNIHLGARDPETGGFVMLGKTFKGMTDEMLAWQTERFTGLMTSRTDWVVHVRPEQVVEIAFDGLQRSTRYPGGLALRFARVVRYRHDKTAGEADTIETVRSLAR